MFIYFNNQDEYSLRAHEIILHLLRVDYFPIKLKMDFIDFREYIQRMSHVIISENFQVV